MGAVSPVYTVMKLKDEVLLPFARMQMNRKFVKDWIENQIEKDELAYLEVYLPEQMSEADVKVKIESLVSSMGDVGPQDFGKVMSAVMADIGDQADGSMVSRILKDLL